MPNVFFFDFQSSASVMSASVVSACVTRDIYRYRSHVDCYYLTVIRPLPSGMFLFAVDCS